MSHELDIFDDVLTEPKRLHVGQVEVAMLWPDDTKTRREVMHSILVEEGRQHITSMDRDVLSLYALEASRARAIQDIQEETRDRYFEGLIAGRLLHDFVGHSGSRSLGELRKQICENLRGQKQLRPRTIENKIWPRFKSVAHLWAAHFGHVRASGDIAMPCRTARLFEFLSEAEFYREAGEKLKAHKSPRPALLRGEALSLPVNVKAAVPKRHLSFVPGDPPAI